MLRSVLESRQRYNPFIQFDIMVTSSSNLFEILMNGTWVKYGSEIKPNSKDRPASTLGMIESWTLDMIVPENVKLAGSGETLASVTYFYIRNGNWISGVVRYDGVYRVNVYRYRQGSWINLGKPIHSKMFKNTSTYRYQLPRYHDIAINKTGDILVIGTTEEISRYANGQVEIYKYINDDWYPLGDVINGEEREYLGEAVAINALGTRIVVKSKPSQYYNELLNSKNSWEPYWDYSAERIKVYEINPLSAVNITNTVTLTSLSSFVVNTQQASSGKNNKTVVSTLCSYIINEVSLPPARWYQIGQTIEADTALAKTNQPNRKKVENSSDEFVQIKINDLGDVIAVLYDTSAAYRAASEAKLPLVRVYKFKNNSWVQVGEDIEPFKDITGGTFLDRYQKTFAINSTGSVVAVGMPYIQGKIGGVRTYQLSSNNTGQEKWIPRGTLITPTIADILGDIDLQFGWEVHLNNEGDILFVATQPDYKIWIQEEKDDKRSSRVRRVYTYIWRAGVWERLNLIQETPIGFREQVVSSINGDGTKIATSKLKYFSDGRPSSIQVYNVNNT